MAIKRVIICDLDGTLTESKSPLGQSMAKTLQEVLVHYRLAIISGGDWPQFQIQFLNNFLYTGDMLKNMFLFPTSGAECYTYGDRGWIQVYDELLTPEEKEKIKIAFGHAIAASGTILPKPYGETIEDRGEQITFSGCGQHAPLLVKAAWDPNQMKRKKIITELQKEISNFEIEIGGATSIDVTRKGINKAYAIRKLEEMLKVSKESIVYIGDALYPGGNDTKALEAGVECIQVSGPEETENILKSFTQGTTLEK